MKSITEKQLITLIQNGQENIFIDFKLDFKLFDTGGQINKQESPEFIKDIIGFLNAPVKGDRFLVFGINENKDGSIDVVGADSLVIQNIKEERFQEFINKYITPTPIVQLDILDYQSKKLIVLTISNENGQDLYSTKKGYSSSGKEISIGTAWMRRGTRVNPMTAVDSLNFSKRTESLFSLINSELINLSKLDNILKFVEFLEGEVIDANRLFPFINFDISLLRKFNDNFYNYVLRGNIDDIKEINEIDGGYESLSEGMFYISKILYELSPDFEFNSWNTILTIKLIESSDMTKKKFLTLQKKVVQANALLKNYISLQYKFSNLFFFKITEIKIHDDTLNLFGESDLKFQVSDNILELFLEPLYAASNSFSVTIRELLQNSFDACKLSSNLSPKISIEFLYENNQLDTIKISDSGIGMNWEDISNYYLKVGNSSKSSSDNGLIGKFGVGALSLFMIGDSCVINTKKCGEEVCSFQIQKDGFIVSRKSNTESTSLEHNSFTEINLMISEKFSNLTPLEIQRMLNVNEYIVQDAISLEFIFPENNFFANNVYVDNEHRYLFDTFNFLESRVSILKLGVEAKEEHRQLYSLLVSKSQSILYNNQLGRVMLKENHFNNINFSNLPLIVIEGNIEPQKGYITELSREKYIVTGEFLDFIGEKIYEMYLPKFFNELENINQKGSSLSIMQKIEAAQLLAKQYSLKLESFVFEDGNLFLCSSGMSVREIYANDITDSQLSNLVQNGIKYMKKTMNSDKSVIARNMDGANTIIMSRNLIQRYIINAQGYNSGFRKEALTTILDSLGVNYEKESIVTRIWDEINTEQKNKEIIELIDKNTVHSLTKLTEEGQQILNKVSEDYPNILILDRCADITYDLAIEEYLNQSRKF
ncbi:TPA: ATP-binding protein [Streptococcus suis]